MAGSSSGRWRRTKRELVLVYESSRGRRVLVNAEVMAAPLRPRQPRQVSRDHLGKIVTGVHAGTSGFQVEILLPCVHKLGIGVDGSLVPARGAPSPKQQLRHEPEGRTDGGSNQTVVGQDALSHCVRIHANRPTSAGPWSRTASKGKRRHCVRDIHLASLSRRNTTRLVGASTRMAVTTPGE